MSKDVIKTKSENLILLWEHLQMEDKKRKGLTHAKLNNSGTIRDYELRHMILNAKPQFINLESLFESFDSTCKSSFVLINNSIL